MKTTLAIAMALMFVSSAYATPVAMQGQQQGAQSNSNSDAQASNAGNTQSIIFTSPEVSTSNANVKQTVSGDTTNRVVYSGTQTVKNVPSVGGPALVTSNDTCHGSLSGSLNVAGFGGGLGSTVVDKNCVMLKNSRELWNMGMRGAALARMCMDADNREALEITGFPCPQTEKAEKDRKAAAVTQQQYTDPVVRARLGLEPLPTDKK
jgi:hypothetical protein